MNLRDAAQMMLQSVDQMLQGGEWYCAAERAESLRAALDEQEQAEPVAPVYSATPFCPTCESLARAVMTDQRSETIRAGCTHNCNQGRDCTCGRYAVYNHG